MNRPFRFALLLALAGSLAAPALAEQDWDRGKHRGHGKHERHEHKHKNKHRNEARRDCPPGLVWYQGECLRKDRFRREARRYDPRVGDRFRPEDYRRIGDPGRYSLQSNDNWNYYRDDNQIYRVDSQTQKVLAVLQLIQAFSN